MRKKILFPTALLLLVFSFVLSLCVGSAQISIHEAISALQNGSLTPDNRILFYVRLPRALAAVLSGAALAVSGVLLQNVLNNALAAPNIIGVNAGAGFAVLFLLAVFPTATAFLPFAAFLGALFASLLIYAVAAKSGASRTTITLAGVALSSVFTAGSNAIKTFFPDTIYNSSSFFIGGFSGIAYKNLTPAWVAILLGLLLAVLFSGEMDVLSLGDETAQSLGMRVQGTRFLLLMTASLLAGGAVSFSGLLGFVGLIVPHILRHFIGARHRILVPLSALFGASFVLLCDTLSRTLFSPYEIPVGIVLSLLGGPFFLFLIVRKKRRKTRMNQNLSTALKFADLCVTLNHAEILRGVSGELRRGEVTGILGPNGCGKTTLLRALCRLIKADSGSITLCGGTAETDIAALAPKALARRVSFLPQQRAVPDITAKTLVSHGRYPYLGFSRTLSNKDRTVIQNALKTAGVSAFADRRLPMLSGGERQRVFLAMLLAQNTDVVLLDEPTTYLDAHHKFELMALLSTLKVQNKAVGIVLHELPLAFKFCDRLLLMKNGQIMQSGTPEELLKTGLIEHLFGVSLTPVMLDKEVEYIERKIHS